MEAPIIHQTELCFIGDIGATVTETERQRGYLRLLKRGYRQTSVRIELESPRGRILKLSVSSNYNYLKDESQNNLFSNHI